MKKLTVQTQITAPIDLVWDCFWNPLHIVNWCFVSADWHCPKATGDMPKVKGVFITTFAAKDGSFSFDLAGKFEEVVLHEKVVYTMGEMKEFFLPAGRQVEIQFLIDTMKGVTLIETFDAEEIHSEAEQIFGWSSILQNFKNYTESLAPQYTPPSSVDSQR